MKLFILIVMFVVSLIGCTPNPNCQLGMVDIVGGCDRTGMCGVVTIDGRYGTAYLPAPGAVVKVCTP